METLLLPSLFHPGKLYLVQVLVTGHSREWFPTPTFYLLTPPKSVGAAAPTAVTSCSYPFSLCLCVLKQIALQIPLSQPRHHDLIPPEWVPLGTSPEVHFKLTMLQEWFSKVGHGVAPYRLAAPEYDKSRTGGVLQGFTLLGCSTRTHSHSHYTGVQLVTLSILTTMGNKS